MKATVLRAPGDLTVEERPRPQPAAQQVLLRVGSVGICGSDVPYYEHGRIGRSVVEDPLVLGHEASGTIEEIGAEVVGLPGQRVSVEPGVPDMSCAQCLAGRYNLCPNMRFFATPPIDGAFCEYVVVLCVKLTDPAAKPLSNWNCGEAAGIKPAACRDRTPWQRRNSP